MWLTLLTSKWTWLALALFGLGAAVSVQTHRLHSAQAELTQLQAKYDLFVESVKQATAKVVAENKQKEQENAKRLTDTRSERDSALLRLRQSEANPRSGFVSVPAAGSGGDSKICYDRAAVDAALRRFDAGTAGLIAEGDKAMIDGTALVNGWPK